MRIPFPILAAAFVVGCVNEPTGSQPEPSEPAVEDGSVQAVVVAEPLRDGMTVMRIRIDAESLELGAYQGRFTFDASAMEFVEASMPDDGYRVLNTLGAAEGEIRFAGFTVEQFVSPVAVELRFQTKQRVDARDVSVNLEVVGTVLGEEVPKGRVLAPSFSRMQR